MRPLIARVVGRRKGMRKKARWMVEWRDREKPNSYLEPDLVPSELIAVYFEQQRNRGGPDDGYLSQAPGKGVP